jgi:hypothetical protein
MINYTKKELKLTPRLQKKLKELNIISVNINERNLRSMIGKDSIIHLNNFLEVVLLLIMGY